MPCAEAQRALSAAMPAQTASSEQERVAHNMLMAQVSAAMPAQTASSEQERVARMAQERRADNERMQITMALRRSAVRGTTYT